MPYGNPQPCNDCGRDHRVGAEAIYCNYVGHTASPSLPSDEQQLIAEEFALAHPAEAEAIRHGRG